MENAGFEFLNRKCRNLTLESIKMQNELRYAIFNNELVLFSDHLSVSEEHLLGFFEALLLDGVAGKGRARSQSVYPPCRRNRSYPSLGTVLSFRKHAGC
ncbi:MAG: hypothetical protein U5K27_02595 [Desulfotignum sp.]|nr:hypothetical protein [Desulfotignum sp.]